jgi:hypothetical protein
MDNRASARIFATDHRLIEISPAGWRLVSANGAAEHAVLVEAAPGTALRYAAAFGSRQRLPDSELNPADIERVVLGWSASDRTWHLGLILQPTLAEARGSRWCGLARWADPGAEAHRAEAVEAGRALAQMLARPLAIVPPRTGEAQAAETETPLPPLPALPYTLDDWLISAPDAHRLRFELRSTWARGRAIRAGLYILWAIGFLVLSVTSLTSGIMLPTPPFLPWLGLACALWLLFLAGRALVLMRRRPRWVEIDGAARVVRSAGSSIAVDQIDSVYATQALKIKRRGAPTEQIRYGEINLLLHDGSFRPIVAQLHFDLKQPLQAGEALPDDAMLRLTEYTVRTTLQAAAVRAARLLGVPVWDDRRVD